MKKNETCSHCGKTILPNDLRHFAYLDDTMEESIVCNECLSDKDIFANCEICGEPVRKTAIRTVNNKNVCPWCQKTANA